MGKRVKKNAKSGTRRPVFRPRARLMLLLGDQLIRDAGIAVFELVKNAYDADATGCVVTLQDIADEENDGRIVVEDDGHGMNLDTVMNVWLEPGTEYRKAQRERGERSSKFNRLPMGEKGVGRFAVHKLGRVVKLVTRSSGCSEVVVTVNWREFETGKYLSEIPVSVIERRPEAFTGRRTGTQITIRDLRDHPWTRRRVRALYRAVTSICSPFGGPEDFTPMLELEPRSDWLKGLMQPEEALDYSL